MRANFRDEMTFVEVWGKNAPKRLFLKAFGASILFSVEILNNVMSS